MESTEYYSKRDSSKGSKPVTADADGTEWRVGEPIGRPGGGIRIFLTEREAEPRKQPY